MKYINSLFVSLKAVSSAYVIDYKHVTSVYNIDIYFFDTESGEVSKGTFKDAIENEALGVYYVGNDCILFAYTMDNIRVREELFSSYKGCIPLNDFVIKGYMDKCDKVSGTDRYTRICYDCIDKYVLEMFKAESDNYSEACWSIWSLPLSDGGKFTICHLICECLFKRSNILNMYLNFKEKLLYIQKETSICTEVVDIYNLSDDFLVWMVKVSIMQGR